MSDLKINVNTVLNYLSKLPEWKQIKILDEARESLKNNYEKIKVNPVNVKCHPMFRDDLLEMCTDLKKYREDVSALIVTKVIYNFFNANLKYKELIMEAIKNGK